jgi:predicted nucleic acid-binding protein
LSFLLDTNAVSDTGKRTPNPGLATWLGAQASDDLWMSVLTMGELRYGALILPDGPRRQELEGWLTQVLVTFADRTLDVDSRIAAAWADVAARHRIARRTVSPADELIAATAIVHDLTVVTRNVRDFQFSGCKLHSPWS